MGLLLWATDIHLDHLAHPSAAREFGRALREENPEADALVLTGDNAEAPTFAKLLRELQSGFDAAVYFILGNHDYYRGSFQEVDQAALALHSPRLHWLCVAPTWLTPEVALCGSEGWYDARYGDPNSDLRMTDFVQIGELFSAQDTSRATLLSVLRARADEDAHKLSRTLSELEAKRPAQIVIATHVPPFRETAWHEGKPSDDRWAPFFTSKATGDVLLAHALEHPEISYLTLCGHTHGSGTYRPLPNLVVYTGRARYGAPDLAGRLHITPSGVRVSLA